MSSDDIPQQHTFLKFVYFLNIVFEARICEADAEITQVTYGFWNDVCYYSLEHYVALLLCLSNQQK